MLVAATLAVLIDRIRPGEGRAVVVNGDAVSVGRGAAWAYLTLRDGVPLELGVALSENAVAVLREGGNRRLRTEYVLRLPALNPTPFRHIVLTRNARGDPPLATALNEPYVGFRFYTISDEERRHIEPGDPAFDRRAHRLPAPEFRPHRYTVLELSALPGTGVYWVDPDSPELRDEGVTHAFLYGSWDGKLILAEPIVTLPYLETRPAFSSPIALPQRYDPGGYHPSAYSISYDRRHRRYQIALRGFKLAG